MGGGIETTMMMITVKVGDTTTNLSNEPSCIFSIPATMFCDDYHEYCYQPFCSLLLVLALIT